MLMIFRRRSDKIAAERDAAQLIRDHGERAFSAAGEMSWREDAGLMSTRHPGHWARVQQEIERKLELAPAHTPRLAMNATPLSHERALRLA